MSSRSIIIKVDNVWPKSIPHRVHLLPPASFTWQPRQSPPIEANITGKMGESAGNRIIVMLFDLFLLRVMLISFYKVGIIERIYSGC